MFIFTLILTVFLEYRNLLTTPRAKFNTILHQYVEYFTKRSFSNQREIRYAYLAACAPVILTLLLLRFVVFHSLLLMLLYLIINIALFMLSVNILTWKEDAKNENLKNNKYNFINTYATHFFAALFWYLVLPSAIGSICYLMVMMISTELKNKGLDLIVYNVVVDKMLFYVNVVPYFILYLFIAAAGDFEAVIHHILQKRKHITKSFYFLDITLQEVVLIAIGKDKFQITPSNPHDNINDTEAGMLQEESFTPEIKPYIVAVLYRASLFYLGLIVLIKLVSILG